MSRAGRVPKGPNSPNIQPDFVHSSTQTWRCRVCSYTPNLDKLSGQCVSCGRDYWGNPGKVPKIGENIQHARESGAT